MTKTQDTMIRDALRAGRNVSVDDMNLRTRYVRRLLGIARSEATPVQIIDLTDVPLEECIKRDQDRDSPIGEAVIRDLHRRFVAGQPYPLPVPEPADIGSGTGDLYIPPKYGEPAVIVSVMVLVGVLVHLHLLALVLPSDHAAAGIRYIGKAERIEKGPFPTGMGLFCVSRELCADRRRPGFMPTHERHSSYSTPVGVDPGGRVFDDVCGQAAEVEPAQSVTLLGFPVGGLADPSCRGEEVPDPGFRARARDVDAVNVFEVGRVDQDPDLFFSLAGGCGEDVLARVELAGWQMPHSVPLAAPSLSEEQFGVADQENVDIDDVAIGHGGRSSCSWSAAMPGAHQAGSAPGQAAAYVVTS